MAERDKDGFYRKTKKCESCGKEVSGQSCRSMSRANENLQWRIKKHEQKNNHLFWLSEKHKKEIRKNISTNKGRSQNASRKNQSYDRAEGCH